MEARLLRTALVAAALMSLGAGYRTTNFVVQAPTAEMARQIGDTAEQLRRDLAIEWLGKEMPNWSQPCPVEAQVAPHLGAGGATSFVFDRGEVFDWNMSIQGSLERILDSVLPHEITHTVFATHFRQPLPRWADEGACTTVEAESERHRQQQMLITFLKTGRGIPFAKMFAMKEYPRDILPLYAQGHSLTTFLLAQGGKAKFLQFVGDGLRTEQWPTVVQQHYGYSNLGELQETWLEWVRQGSPPSVPQRGGPNVVLASNTQPVHASGNTASATPKTAMPATYTTPQPQTAVNQTASDSLYQGGRWRAVGATTAVAPAAPQGSFNEAPGTTYISLGDRAVPIESLAVSGGGNSASGDSASQATRLNEEAAQSNGAPTQLIRPQPPQTTQQTILEWTGSSGGWR